jgi:ribonuclease T1
MTRTRTWLGLLVAVLAAALLWWQQGDGAAPADESRTTPSASSSPTATDPGEVPPTSEAPGLPSPSNTAAAPTPPPGGPIDPVSGLPVIPEQDLPAQAHDTLALIDGGGPYPYAQDDSVFENREQILPDQPRGYYREYTVRTPGSDDRGARRIVTGSGGEYYWTDDHYTSFSRIGRSAQ